MVVASPSVLLIPFTEHPVTAQFGHPDRRALLRRRQRVNRCRLRCPRARVVVTLDDELVGAAVEADFDHVMRTGVDGVGGKREGPADSDSERQSGQRDRRRACW
jgi:ketosteroid isomerase-like protein